MKTIMCRKSAIGQAFLPAKRKVVMKRFILTVMALSAAIVAGMYANRSKAPVAKPVETANPPAEGPIQQLTEHRPIPKEVVAAAKSPLSNVGTSGAESHTLPPPATDSKLLLAQAVETLVSPQTTYQQRQETWKQLRQTGKLDETIAELEQRVSTNPRSTGDVTALGEGYYKKAGNTDDVRERAMLAMKADQTLEAALNLDSSNWEARFTKATGMSYWPAELNKRQEVIQEFLALIQQQETEPPQPQFARTYLLLGQQYEKAGNASDATQVWQRGTSLFPNDTDLQGKLTSQAAAR